MISRSPSETQALASQLDLPPGLVIALIGDLAAGKTTFVQGLAQALNCKDYVVSPTFTLVNEYLHGDIPIYHIDLYRIQTLEEAIASGLHEYLPSQDGITLVEWADQIPELMPLNYLKINIKVCANGNRLIDIYSNQNNASI